ncbi:MAG: leucine-rich repeat domain-containing protein [Lachnospiraceae bacterium]|nr:leucine-rich repeat domain-containing protein [Lachnospiraceae bacterium]
MKRKRKLFGILFIITALLIMQIPVAEADAATSASDFKVEGDTLVKYQGTEKSVTVPNTVEVIGEDAFEGNTNIERVVLPNSVTRIDAYAFWGCENLESVILGDGLIEVGDYVFANCKGLKTMSIPSNIRSIGIQAFVDCVNMTDIDIPPEVISIHDTAFDGCYRLMIHAEVGSIADKYAKEFYEKQKEMPEYEDVADYESDEENTEDKDADDKTNSSDSSETVTGATIGSTKVVGNQAVVFVDNTNLEVLEGKENTEVLETTKQDEEISVQGIPKYTIVDETVVADQAYYRSKNLEAVTLPEGIKEIGQFAFARSSVKEILLPDGVETIGYGAFYHCDALTKIELPQTITNVEPKTFTHTAWVDSFIQNGTEDFLVSGGVLVAYRGNHQQVTIPEGVRVIAGEAFAGHSEISELTLPNSLVTIGEAAFENCTGLKNVFWGEQLQQIKDRAFVGCAITTATLPASVEEMGLKAFDEKVELKYGGGHIPAQTIETSAQRLSNESYRPCKDETDEAGVTVYGVEHAYAHLEGAARSYSLTIAETADKTNIEKAFSRNLQSEMPVDVVIYDLLLTDNSGIPITKLGKQPIQVTLPVPESLAAQNLRLFVVDRNGQLEELPVERVKLDGVDSFRFTTNYVSQIALSGNGTHFDESYILEETTSIVSMSGAPQKSPSVLPPLQWGVAGILTLVGICCIFWKR